MPQSNTLKCRYCAYTCNRFIGKKGPQQRKLLLHVVEEHEHELMQALGYAGDSILEYFDAIEEHEHRDFGYILNIE